MGHQIVLYAGTSSTLRLVKIVNYYFFGKKTGKSVEDPTSEKWTGLTLYKMSGLFNTVQGVHLKHLIQEWLTSKKAPILKEHSEDSTLKK